MLFRFVNANKLALPLIYIFFLGCLVAALGYLFYAQVTCQGCSVSSINPSSFLMPIIAYLSIGLVGITIGFTRKTASEKNALEFEKEMSELGEHFQVLYTVRQGMLLPDGNLNRRKAVAYMHELYAPASSSTAAPGATKAEPSFESGDDSATQFFFYSSSTTDGAGTKRAEHVFYTGRSAAAGTPKSSSAAKKPATSEDAVRASASVILNAMEGCANAIRYGIYDEDFIYNIYGSQFIDLYELTYGLIKARQIKKARLWVNFEWLAVKWTLRRNITGVISKESVETSHIINQSLAALKEHNKIRPITKKLKQFEAKLERRKFPR
ncbi:DUF4760 domain-containing protein [Pseudomonas sp. SJZ131]|uniref:DUF4760 domain-containing protein n=1 Tax=Pseudomonas sp. SJZ131 TaxID=2572895 RepID=UPI00119BA6B7|nr:DUF4760 domain-containing protein [Pseudomonas sp. SJZ131]TWD44592.1 uncharacterized protein DUF4760 [Pseudomonas sp. SJZ131]